MLQKLLKELTKKKLIFKVVIPFLTLILVIFSFFLVKTINKNKDDIYAKRKRSSHIEMVKIPDLHIEMSKFEVTQDLYDFVIGNNPSYFQDKTEEYQTINGKKFSTLNNELFFNLPVENVSWYDAVYFCNKLSEMNNLVPVYKFSSDFNVELQTGKVSQNLNATGYRLPTKDEWEAAALGGGITDFSGSNYLDEIGWYKKNSGSQTHEVGKKTANTFGLYDMSGNVWEWCWDSYVGNYHYNRGGSFVEESETCKIQSQRSCSADYKSKNLGFRVVKSVK